MILEFLTDVYTSITTSIYDAIINFRFHHIFQYFFYISVLLYCWRTLQQIFEHIFPSQRGPHDTTKTPSQQEHEDTRGEWLDDEEKREEGEGEGAGEHDEDEKGDEFDGLINRKKRAKSSTEQPNQPAPPLPPRTHPKHKMGTLNQSADSVPDDPAVAGTLSLLRTHVVDVISFHEYHLKKTGPGTLFINVDMATGSSSHEIIKIWKSYEQPIDWEGPFLYLNAEQVLRTGDACAISMLKSYDPTREMIWILYRTETGVYTPQQTWSYRIAYDKQDKQIQQESTIPDTPNI